MDNALLWLIKCGKISEEDARAAIEEGEGYLIRDWAQLLHALLCRKNHPAGECNFYHMEIDLATAGEPDWNSSAAKEWAEKTEAILDRSGVSVKDSLDVLNLACDTIGTIYGADLLTLLILQEYVNNAIDAVRSPS